MVYGFGSGMMSTYVSMADMYMGAGSGAVPGFCVGGPTAATRAVTDICGSDTFAVVARTVQIFRVGSLPVVSLLKCCLLN